MHIKLIKDSNSFAADTTKAVPLSLCFFICVPVVSSVAVVLSLFVRHLSFLLLVPREGYAS